MKLTIFSHGKESSPRSSKIKMLSKVAKDYGYETAALDYTKCKNVNERVVKLKKYIKSIEFESLLLVGSSMGAYVSTVLSNEHDLIGLFLLSPAFYMTDNEYKVKDFHPKCNNIEIIHAWNDDVVPYINAVKFGEQTKAVVNLINDSHQLKNSYPFIEERFHNFLRNID